MTRRFWVAATLSVPLLVMVIGEHIVMFTLISLGIGVAYGYSVIITLFPNLFRTVAGDDIMPAVYFESASVITALVSLG
jgi:Cu+-exporting ATPase